MERRKVPTLTEARPLSRKKWRDTLRHCLVCCQILFLQSFKGTPAVP